MRPGLCTSVGPVSCSAAAGETSSSAAQNTPTNRTTHSPILLTRYFIASVSKTTVILDKLGKDIEFLQQVIVFKQRELGEKSQFFFHRYG